jgi:fatty-acyl-CoA synthase
VTLMAFDWIAKHAAAQPDAPAIHDLLSDRHYTYAQLNDRVDRAGLFLDERCGVSKGDRIALLMHNSSDMVELIFAAWRIGAICVPMNWRLAVPEIAYIIGDCQPKAVFHSPELTENAEAAVLQYGQHVMLVEADDGQKCHYEGGLRASYGNLPEVEYGFDDPWVILYTSGTTGRPKGAQITYGMQFFNAVNCVVANGIGKESHGLTVLPLFHVGGLCVYLSPVLHAGGQTTIMHQFDAPQMLGLLTDRDIGITHVLGVPTNFLFMSKLPAFASAKLDHLQCVGVGGAAPAMALLETYAKKGVLFEHAWGMTETSSIGTSIPKHMALKKIGSCGLPVQHVECKIADEKGNTLPPGAVGELLIRGPTVTSGYWKLPEATAQAFLPGGWFKTGDAARVDQDGYYYIVDRWKDMYISGGENVYPLEVEDALYRLNGVAECAVIGIHDQRWGEVGRAFIVAEASAGLTEARVIAHCRAQLAHYKAPKSVRFIDELPHNATGKVTKHLLPRD